MSKAVALSAAVLAVCLSACGNEGVSPQNAADYAQNVTDLFRQSCVAADGDAAIVGEFANANKLVLLSKKDMADLPAGMMDLEALSIWKKTVNGADYYLSLTEDSCSVRTAKANDHLIFKQFLALAENPPQGLNAELRADNLAETPLPMRQISYAWRASGSPKETLLTVKTTSFEHFPVQAVFYLTHHSYDNKAAVLP